MSIHPPLQSDVTARRAHHPESRGFVMVLVLLLVFLIMILVITYLRTLRSYNSVPASSATANSGVVAQEVANALATLIGQDGNLAVQEPYDYPWTCSRMNAPYSLAYPITASGVGALGDPKFDDSWLMPLEPVGGKWSQLSNPFGSFVAYGVADFSTVAPNFATRLRVPMDAPAGAPIPGVALGGDGSPQSVEFRNIDVTDPRLIDTDGDGVGDAMWFYPANPRRNGIRYVAGVRIVDLSGMVNLNTALGEFATAPNTTSGTPRKGEGPYEINGSLLLGAMDPLSKTMRQGAFTAGPSPAARLPASWTDWDYWWASGARTQDDGTPSTTATNRYGLTDELQLRDYSNQYTVTPYPLVRKHYPALVNDLVNRNRVTTLGGICDVCAPLPCAAWRDPNSASFNSNNSTASYARRPVDISTFQMNLNNPAPAAPYPSLSGVTADGFVYQGAYDKRNFDASGTYAVTDFFQGMNNLATVSLGASPLGTEYLHNYPYPEGFKFLTRYTDAGNRALQYQTQGICSLQAALGRDNAAEQGWEWHGWEPLPIMTEFYAQMPYVASATNTLSLASSNGTTFVTLMPNTTLAQITVMNAYFNGVGHADTYFWTDNGTSITFQLQNWDGTYTRCAAVTLTQSGADVRATQQYIWKQANVVGQDMVAMVGTSGVHGTATGDNWLTTYFPVPVQAADGTWSNIYTNMQETRFPVSPNPIGTTTVGNTDWRYGLAAGMGSYALELANPYKIPIRLANLRFSFRRFDYYQFDTNNWTNNQMGPSLDISAYVNANPPVGMARDAEGYYVLKPGEKVVFYRNGTENSNAPSGSTDNAAYFGAPRANLRTWQRPFGGPVLQAGTNDVDLATTLFPSGAPASTFLVNLGVGTPGTPDGAGNWAPDINGHPSTTASNRWDVESIEIQARGQFIGGGLATGNSVWVPCQRALYEPLVSGWAANNSFDCEQRIPAGRQTAPGSLVYKQVDVKTFGVDEKLDLLQARPPYYVGQSGIPPLDWGDWEMNTNTYAVPAKGLMTVTIPRWGTLNASNTWSPGKANSASTLPLSTSWMAFNPAIHSLGQSTKVVFPGASTDYPGSGGARVSYGTRPSIKNEEWLWNYVGIPGDANYPGTFPELTAVNNANTDVRNCSTASPNIERRDSLPRVLDLLKVPWIGPVWFYHWPGSSWGGNWDYRGTPNATEVQGTGSTASANSPLVGNWWANTIMDAVHFYLTKDIEVNGPANSSGLRGLCLRTDVPWFDLANINSKYPNLPYSGSTVYANGAEVLYNGEVYQAQNSPPAGTAPTSSNIGTTTSGKFWTWSTGPYAKAAWFWQASWAEVLCSRWQVDSPKYKGKTGANGDNWKPGMINLNTASKQALLCLSLPTGVDKNKVADAIIANRAAPPNGFAGKRQGLALASEALGAGGLRSFSSSSGLPAAFYTSDPDLNLETLSWIPQQASCRSDVFCAYIVVQGYPEDDFTRGMQDTAKMIVIFSRDCSGGNAKPIGQSILSRRTSGDGDPNDWYTP